MNLMTQTALHNGKYVLDTQLGKGIFEITYQATNTESGQRVVIKTFSETLRQHPDFDHFKQQFLEFGDRLRRCQHPNLVRVLDCFEDAGLPYWVMKFIPGQTLAELIQADVLPEAKAVEYIRQIGDGLIVLHKAGLLHRNIKPENIIRRQDTDTVVVCEFGMTCELTAGMLQTHTNLFSAGYAPPEQYSFQEQRTTATDIYTLAATLYCLLTGQPPLPAPVRETLQTQGSDRLFSPDFYPNTHNLSPSVKQAVWQGLELSAEKRPQTVEAWLALLPKREVGSTTPQLPPLPERSVAQPKAQDDIKPTSTNSKTPQEPTPEKIPAPQPELAQNLVTQFKTPSRETFPTGTKLKTSKARQGLPKPGEAQLSRSSKGFLKGRGSLLRALLITGAIAASAGVGFGFALRINGPNQPGSSFLHTDQSFPPTSKWPLSEPQL
jgi:serine/threonine-protein kinase